ncbi:MAG: hypothetical protein CUN49_13940 [Candidatus Thermofonsia Clade 1 bacterium]|uniref:Uncharacterized protein n=1 Tax=Candidatus Thermofonsia Clade 1 bacterium TaxID=2364210 RepID=A0A2M8PB51_9CHLR|nr:MAG: hypothetical protein CUN49_13940 [Candidatus Thermofonsia Clade 1 bacterium]RMF52688.1 MAG: hypothetical protein D6749_04255 [Chloroflexota bacterium]
MGFFRRPIRDHWQDPTERLIIVAALIYVGILLGTRFFPGTESGLDCNGLSRPVITGNNQSILATRVDPSVLAVELVIPKPTISASESLVMEVRLVNTSLAPLTLFYDEPSIRFRFTGQEPGLVFAIQALNGRVVGEPFNVRPQVPQPQAFDRTLLRVLPPRARCNVRVEIDSARLAASGVTPGQQYRIIAVYRNAARGQLPVPGPLTPTPIFGDQGVWIGEVRSNDVVITVNP